jgi:hypothetical protein
MGLETPKALAAAPSKKSKNEAAKINTPAIPILAASPFEAKIIAIKPNTILDMVKVLGINVLLDFIVTLRLN